MNVYAVSDDDVIWFDSIRECRKWIKEKAFIQAPDESWSIYRVSDYDSDDPDAEAWPLETYYRSDFIGYIVSPGQDGFVRTGARTIDEARRVAANVLSQGKRYVDIQRVTGRRGTVFVESYTYPDMPKVPASGPVKRKGGSTVKGASRNRRGRVWS